MPRWLIALALFAAALPARAEYPERPITLIVGFAAGGGTDIAARTVGRFMERRLGQPVIIVNRPGAAGGIGYAATARAAPDGYTIGTINTPNVVSLPIERSIGYRFEELQAVANIVDDPGALWVRAASPIRTVADLLALARSRPPESLGWGSTGRGTYTDFTRLALEKLTNTQFTLIAYGGTQPIIAGLLAQDLAVGVFSLSEGSGAEAQGLVRPIGLMAEARAATAPNVPTFREQGFDVVGGSMRGVAAPAGVPRAIVEKLAATIRDVMADPEFQAAARQQYLPLRYLGPDEHQALLLRMQDEYRRVWAERPWRE
jgi:tripartite-type tricarboxylate transporter receptor subunit TctC